MRFLRRFFSGVDPAWWGWLVFGLCLGGSVTWPWAAAGQEATKLADLLRESVATPPIADVVLHNGILQGCVVGDPGEDPSRLGLSIHRGDKAVGVTVTDHEGRFTFAGLSAGVYRLVVKGPGGPRSVFCRTWTRRQAPPHAAGAVHVLLGSPTVRGQIPLPTTHFPQAVAIAAVAGGTIAAPVIYNNAKKQNQIPASP